MRDRMAGWCGACSVLAFEMLACGAEPMTPAGMDTGHGGTWNIVNGGEFGRVGLGWLNWQLKGDDAAKKMFVGPDCELCKAPSKWVIKKKMLD